MSLHRKVGLIVEFLVITLGIFLIFLLEFAVSCFGMPVTTEKNLEEVYTFPGYELTCEEHSVPAALISFSRQIIIGAITGVICHGTHEEHRRSWEEQ